MADLDKAMAEKERLLVIKADLEQAQKKLQEYEALLKEGKTLPVDADDQQHDHQPEPDACDGCAVPNQHRADSPIQLGGAICPG